MEPNLPPHPAPRPHLAAVQQVHGERRPQPRGGPLGKRQPLWWASRRAAASTHGLAAGGSRHSEQLRQVLPPDKMATAAAATHPAASRGSRTRQPRQLLASPAADGASRDLCVCFHGLCGAYVSGIRDFSLAIYGRCDVGVVGSVCMRCYITVNVSDSKGFGSDRRSEHAGLFLADLLTRHI